MDTSHKLMQRVRVLIQNPTACDPDNLVENLLIELIAPFPCGLNMEALTNRLRDQLMRAKTNTEAHIQLLSIIGTHRIGSLDSLDGQNYMMFPNDDFKCSSETSSNSSNDAHTPRKLSDFGSSPVKIELLKRVLTKSVSVHGE